MAKPTNEDDGKDDKRVEALHAWLHGAGDGSGSFRSTKWNAHASHFAKLLDIDGGSGGADRFINRLKKNKARPQCCEGARNFDVGDDPSRNILRLRQVRFGRKTRVANRVDFHNPTIEVATATQKECYYSVGETPISVKDQLEFVQTVTGQRAEGVPPSTQLRRKQWQTALLGGDSADDRSYRLLDLPTFAIQFRHLWETVSIPDHLESEDDINSDQLLKVQAEIINILRYSFVMPSEGNVSILDVDEPRDEGAVNAEDVSGGPSGDRDEDSSSQEEEDSPQPRKRSRLSSSGGFDEVEEPEDRCRIEEFDLGELKRLWYVDRQYMEVGRREILIEGVLNECSMKSINHTIHALGAAPFSKDEFDRVKYVADENRSKLQRYYANFDALKATIREKENEYHWNSYKLREGIDLLTYWVKGHELANSGRVEHKMYTDGDSGPVMTTATAVVCRHIIMSHNVPLSTFPGMLSSFAVLLLGRPLEANDFFSSRTVRNHIIRLSIIDDFFIGRKVEEVFNGSQRYGFERNLYSTTDDTKHKSKKTHHVVVRTCDRRADNPDEECFSIDPMFDCLSAGLSEDKTAKANARHNFEVLRDTFQSLEALSKYNGNTSDNAAVLEGVETFKMVMDHLEDEGREDLTKVYGVARECIIHADPFHCCNLAIQHASEKAHGKTDKGNSRQFHVLQSLQTLHDLVSVDPAFAQSLANEIFSDNSLGDDFYIIKTVRERMQRWLVNGRNAKYILEGHNIFLSETSNTFWVEWAERYSKSADGWMKQALKEVITFFSSDEIIIGLQYEAELVDYFEVTYQWHAYPGELCSRPGFRTMELHHLLFEFIVPFWEEAVEKPEVHFPKTFKLIETLREKEEVSVGQSETGSKAGDDDAEGVAGGEIEASYGAEGDEAGDDPVPLMTYSELADLKRDQIMYGLQAGYDEICKMYQRMLKAPMIFLGVMDPKVGPSLFRAILALVKEAGVDIDEATTAYDNGKTYDVQTDDDVPEWGEFEWKNMARPDEEKIWYEWLESDKTNLAHWFKQIGFHRKVVHRDLRRLSNETTRSSTASRDPESSNRLRDFFGAYPVLFTALRAVFALLPSASRIVESAHGMMRDFYDPQMPTQILNAKMRYKMDTDYKMKEKRRELIRKKLAAAGNVARRSAKPSDRKETHVMIGEQLEEQIESYSVDALADLPADVQRRIRISAINKSNARSQEDLLERRKAEVAERKRQRREEAGHSLDVGALKTAARGMLTEHSRGWKMRDDRAEMTLIAEMLKKKYWRNLAAADFKVELFRVLPSFRSDDTWRATKTQILKKDSPTDLGKYLDLIESNAKKIDEGKVEEISDTLGVEIEDGITGDEYKKLIVKHGQSIIQERQVSDATKHRRRLRAVFKHVGTELSTKKRFTSEATYSQMAEKVAAEEEEEDEGMQIL